MPGIDNDAREIARDLIAAHGTITIPQLAEAIYPRAPQTARDIILAMVDQGTLERIGTRRVGSKRHQLVFGPPGTELVEAGRGNENRRVN